MNSSLASVASGVGKRLSQKVSGFRAMPLRHRAQPQREGMHLTGHCHNDSLYDLAETSTIKTMTAMWLCVWCLCDAIGLGYFLSLCVCVFVVMRVPLCMCVSACIELSVCREAKQSRMAACLDSSNACRAILARADTLCWYIGVLPLYISS